MRNRIARWLLNFPVPLYERKYCREMDGQKQKLWDWIRVFLVWVLMIESEE